MLSFKNMESNGNESKPDCERGYGGGSYIIPRKGVDHNSTGAASEQDLDSLF